MDLVALLGIQVLYAIASLALISVGLAIIFGMMKVINLAHGEFLMLGGYAAIEANRFGLNIWIAMLVVSPIVVGVFGPTANGDRFALFQIVDATVASTVIVALLIAATYTRLPWRPLPGAESNGTETPNPVPDSETRQPTPVPDAYAESS